MGSHLWADWGSWVHAWPCGCPSLPPKWAAHRKGRGQRCRPGPRPERSDERSAKTARVQRDGRQRGGIGRVWGPRRTLEPASELPRPAEAPRGRESHCDSVAGVRDLHRSCPLCHAGMSSVVVLRPPSRLCRGPRGRSPWVASVRSQPVRRGRGGAHHPGDCLEGQRPARSAVLQSTWCHSPRWRGRPWRLRAQAAVYLERGVRGFTGADAVLETRACRPETVRSKGRERAKAAALSP